MSAEFDILVPHVKNRLQAPVTVDGFEPNWVHVPGADLDWTGSPRFELGYRLAQGYGEFLLSYRFLVSEGNATLFGFDLDGSDGDLRSRLNVNVVDLDYSSREYSLWPHWDMKWKVGARLATIFFDNRATGLFLEQRTSNNFVGAGPHVGLDLTRTFDNPRLGLFARIEGASLLGEISQSFEESVLSQDNTLAGGATLVHHSQAVPIVEVQAGLSWTPTWWNQGSRFVFGYMFQRWWDVGKAGFSRAELTTQGVFLRGEFGF
jgi:hypothetical protein